MKTGTSTLNPYAASYIPLSKRATVGETKGLKSEERKTLHEAAWGSQPDNYNDPSLRTADSTKLSGHPVQGYYSSSSNHAYDLIEKQIGDEEIDMDMAYLQMTFPGISDECLCGVYLANKGDIEETIDMLRHLEEDSEKLPDTLDIGDVSEPQFCTEFAPQKLKVTGEAGPSSSGSSELRPGSN